MDEGRKKSNRKINDELLLWIIKIFWALKSELVMMKSEFFQWINDNILHN